MVKDGEPWFVASDVAAVLGYSDVNQAVRMHCKNKTLYTVPVDLTDTKSSGRGGLRADTTISIIPERDLYRLIMRSKLPAAERFEEWIMGEVIPSVLKHGMEYVYRTNQTGALLDDPCTRFDKKSGECDDVP